MTERLICLAALVIGYCFGLLQVAHIYSRSKNINIRKKGSGNPGTTNMFRVMGIKAGIITLIGDCAKCVAAVFFTRLIFITILNFDIPLCPLTLYTGIGCVLGHDFPFFFKFKGGKGMATTAALLCCVGNWQMVVCGLAAFFGVVIITRYVSLGSMVTVSLEAVLFIIFTQVGLLKVEQNWLPDCYVLMVALAVLLIFQHRKNIKRLVNHEETKFYFRTSEQIKEDEMNHRETQVNAKVEKVQMKADKKVDKLQARADKRVDKLQSRVEKKVESVQTRVEHVQNKAEYKETKVQMKADLKQENSRNWAGKIADKAPDYFRQKDNSDQNNG